MGRFLDHVGRVGRGCRGSGYARSGMVAKGAGHLTRPPALRSAPEVPHSRASPNDKSCERESPDGHRGYALGKQTMAETMPATQDSGKKPGRDRKRKAEELSKRTKPSERRRQARHDPACRHHSTTSAPPSPSLTPTSRP